MNDWDAVLRLTGLSRRSAGYHVGLLCFPLHDAECHEQYGHLVLQRLDVEIRSFMDSAPAWQGLRLADFKYLRALASTPLRTIRHRLLP